MTCGGRRSTWSVSPTVAVVRFDLDDAHEELVPSRELCRAVIPVDCTYPLALGGNLLVVLGQWRAFNTVQPPVLIAIDWRGPSVVQIDIPCLQNDPPKIAGMDFTIQDDNILLYRYKQDNQLEVYTYFNISSHMQPLSTMTLRETPDRIPPDAWATVDLTLPPVLPNDPWAFLHIRNTPSVSTLRHAPIMARASHSLLSDSTGRPDESRITSLVWLDLCGMLADLREGRFQRGEKALTLERFIKGRGYYSDSKLQAARGWVQSDVGTCGRHVLWIRQGIIAHEEEGAQEDEDAVQWRTEHTVELIKLPFVGEDFDEETTSKSLRTLQVPLGIDQTMALVRFCDEWGILGYMNTSPMAMQSIHIFDY
ncbi:hypothetical protein M407DRAFT_87266 [Tulasnella calospora MUT 4182]|uniref:Uncharacterized protein n=1 Tax=Tulasnella calospora MUT 4182 TaxID=1051891 RepID=A0A0C3QYS2_9AGAM|nr:hypothetical protein M407DRAFT_87266 [Tulasnella calospora MUT 4182]